jgi:tetratricopeptide (TPR) repeat protein
MAVAYNQLGSYDRALAAITKSVELEPGRPHSYLQMGMAYAGLGDDDAAAGALRRSIVISLADNDYRRASNTMRTLKSMGLESQLTSDDLEVLEKRIATLTPT